MRVGTECEDSNLNDLKGCKSDCSGPMTGYSCDSSSPSICSVICGDGISIETETCDDADYHPLKGCNSTCSGPLNGWTCSLGSPTTASTCSTLYICGDGLVDSIQFEVCDDGTDDGLGCETSCVGPAPGFTCTPDSPSVCTPICNDGMMFSPENCDDGSNDAKGCNSDCSGVLPGWYCSGGGPISPTSCQV